MNFISNLYLSLYNQIDLFDPTDPNSPLNREGEFIGPQYRLLDIGRVIFGLVQYLVIAAGIVMLICVIWSGLEWQLSRGDAGKIEDARNRLSNCLVGLTLVMLAMTLFVLVQYFLGIDVFVTTP